MIMPVRVISQNFIDVDWSPLSQFYLFHVSLYMIVTERNGGMTSRNTLNLVLMKDLCVLPFL